MFFPEYWGYGYATESLLAVKTVLTKNGIAFMRATVATPNITSARVLEKAGFIRGNLVADEIDTHEFTRAIPKESISAAHWDTSCSANPRHNRSVGQEMI